MQPVTSIYSKLINISILYSNSVSTPKYLNVFVHCFIHETDIQLPNQFYYSVL